MWSSSCKSREDIHQQHCMPESTQFQHGKENFQDLAHWICSLGDCHELKEDMLHVSISLHLSVEEIHVKWEAK